MISEEYIMKAIETYAKSPGGKAEIKRKTGITYVDKNPSATLMKYGEQMKMILYYHANSLIKSIMPDDIVVNKPYQDSSGIWKLNISFKDGSLHRNSLDSDDYPEGLNNIVLLFAKGYHARNYVYGQWADKYGDYGNVRSRKDREGNAFLIQAINEFNVGVGKDIAIAQLLGEYEKCSRD